MGNHKLVESAVVLSVQNGFKPAALPGADTGCNDGNKDVGGELDAQIGRLTTLQVAALCTRRGSGVDDLFLLFLLHGGGGNDCLATTMRELSDIRLDEVEALSAAS